MQLYYLSDPILYSSAQYGDWTLVLHCLDLIRRGPKISWNKSKTIGAHLYSNNKLNEVLQKYTDSIPLVKYFKYVAVGEPFQASLREQKYVGFF